MKSPDSFDDEQDEVLPQHPPLNPMASEFAFLDRIDLVGRSLGELEAICRSTFEPYMNYFPPDEKPVWHIIRGFDLRLSWMPYAGILLVTAALKREGCMSLRNTLAVLQNLQQARRGKREQRK